LIRTALADASGDALDGALKTVDSFVDADDGAAGTA
jgi:hypothetical protein